MDSDSGYFQALALFAQPLRSARRLSVETATMEGEYYSHDSTFSPSQTTSIEDSHLEWSRVIMQGERKGRIIETRKPRYPSNDWVCLLERHRVSQEEEEGGEFQKDPKLESDDCDTMIVSKVSRVQQEAAAAEEEEAQKKQREEMNKRIRQLEKENALLWKLTFAVSFVCILLARGIGQDLLLALFDAAMRLISHFFSYIDPRKK
ncbi:hypothetical protein DSL72_005558 [Monilinia vaccinii-corymbosi]|uniref:Uncharacterized protein n=1 Tax=Monilinia vaccinii-corymbosi TaxID=61207 RepID=A0A8A3PFM8_9HELO|nr:hypothetical protein DSL72_005558 [Monilinia vaccinii-corymbosi]